MKDINDSKMGSTSLHKGSPVNAHQAIDQTEGVFMFGRSNSDSSITGTTRHHGRRLTMPFAHTSRHKPRRWPLVLRFIKGAIHGAIIVPVVLHTLFAVLIVFVDRNLEGNLGLPPSIIPSLSIVVGLMLVFRNQTSYNRFQDGSNHLTIIMTNVRNLTRMFLVCSYKSSPLPDPKEPGATAAERFETESIIKILIGILYATKAHLRADWGADYHPHHSNGTSTPNSEYRDLLPPGFMALNYKGLGMTLQLTMLIEQYIKRGVCRSWFHPPQASQMEVQLNTLVDAYSRMEQIRLTPIPVAHLIHQKQVLALFGMVLPFAMVDEMGWWAVPIVTLVIFTLYGIEGIGSQLEDPFGTDKIDINMDAMVEDMRDEILVMLEEWGRIDGDEGKWFVGVSGQVSQLRVDVFE